MALFKRKKIIQNQKKNTKWITPSIIALCELKKALHLLNKRQSHQILQDKYKLVCKKLNNSIKESKRDYYNKLMANSKNKLKTTMNIIKSLRGKVKKQEPIHTLCINESVITDPQITSNSFN
jgi:hypothetical protein